MSGKEKEMDSVDYLSSHSNSESDSDVAVDVSNVDAANHIRKHVSEKWPVPKVPVILQFKNITYKIPKGERILLKNVSGMVKPGRFLAIMGPTGSGKTTLLTALSGRIPDLEPGSKLLINGKPPNKDYKRQVSFVLQDDVLFGNLTVEQTLRFTARLRLGYLTKMDQEEQVNQVIDLLNLHKARYTLIGGPTKRGVSGGERKRVNIGNELLTQPSLIFLDEPTSGLDTSTGINLIQILKGLSEAGLTVVAAIHQPSSQMFALFDDLMLLVDGNVTYYGPADNAVTYFGKIGFQCSKFFNPADFMMGLILEEELKKQGGSTMSQTLINAWEKESSNLNLGNINSEEDKKLLLSFQEKQDQHGTPTYGTNFFKQVEILTIRSIHQTRHIVFNKNDFIQTLLISIIVSALWWQLPYRLDYFNDRLGAIFFVSTYIALFFPAFKALMTFPSERAVILRERTSGSYRLSSYFIAKLLNEIPFMWEHPLLMLLIVYFTFGLHLSPASFFTFFGINLVSVWTSASMGLLVSAFAGPDLNLGLTTLTIVAMTTFLTGGFFVQHFPSWLTWLFYLSYLKYSLDACMLNELSGTTWEVVGNVTSLNGMSTALHLNSSVNSISGDDILTGYPIFIHSVGLNVFVMFGFGVLYRLLALGMLQVTMAIPKPKKRILQTVDEENVS